MQEIREIHIGHLIQEKLKEQGRSASWLAEQIPCSPKHIYKILGKESLQTDLLLRISKIMKYNFFLDFNIE